MRYIKENDDGSVSVVDVVEDWAVPEGAIPLPDGVVIPREFRDALRACPKHGIRHCMATARGIQRQGIRQARAGRFLETDAALVRSIAMGRDPSAVLDFAQQLRDAPAMPAIDAAQSIADLKAAWPEVLTAPVPGHGAQLAPFTLPPPAQPPPFAPKREEPEPVAIEDEIYPQDPEDTATEAAADEEEEQSAPPPLPEPMPRVISRPPAEASLADAMRRVELAEQDDEPLPEYAPLPDLDPIFDPLQQAPIIKPLAEATNIDLKTAVDQARTALTSTHTLYDLSLRALNGNFQAKAVLAKRAERFGLSIEALADNTINQYRACEMALVKVLDVELEARDDFNASGDAAHLSRAIETIRGIVDAATVV